MKFIRLTVITQNGKKLSALIPMIHIVFFIEAPNGDDQRAGAEIMLHGGTILKVAENIEYIGKLLSEPDLLSGAILNPQEQF